MRCYVAASSRELDRARRVMTALRLAGVRIALDWTRIIDDHADIANAGLDAATACRIAAEEVGAVRSTDVLLLLAPGPGVVTAGAWVELGVALATGKRVIVSGDAEACIFARLADVTCATDAEAIGAVIRAAREAA